MKGCEAPSSLPFILDLRSLSASCLCSYQEMEFLDITSIRDTRFGKFAKMPKVSGPSSSPGSARPPAPRGWGRSPCGGREPDPWSQGRVRGLSRGSLPELSKGLWYQGTVDGDVAWPATAPRAPQAVWEVLLASSPPPPRLLCLYLPNAGRKIGGRDWWKTGFPETGD